MKKLLLLLVLIVILLLIWRIGCRFITPQAAAPSKWYVSATGNNNNDGRSPSTPWATLDKVSSASSSMAAGDTIFFKRGDVFPGSLVMKAGGSSSAPIVISAYGTGGNPVLTGLIALTGWVNQGGNIWQSGTPAKTIRKDVNIFTINGVPQAVGRTDWLVYQSANATQLTSSNLTGSPNYSGAEIVMRKNTYVAERASVTSQSGSTVTYTNDIQPITNGSKFGLINGTSGMGFFFQRFAGSLDKYGEWFFDKSANKFKLYSTSNPSSSVIKTSYVDTVVNLRTRNNIVVENITVEGGNIYGVESDLANNVHIKNCTFLNNTNPIYMWNVNDAMASGNTILYSLSRGILISDNQTKRINVLNNYMWHTGQLFGMAVYNHEYSMRAIVARTSDDGSSNYVNIIGNTVKLTGQGPIYFQGSHVLVRRNWTDSFASQLDDMGGIYTFVNNQSLNTSALYIDRLVDSNMVSNALGAPLGSRANHIDVSGIYLDDQAPDVIVRHNSVWNIPGNAIQLNNVKNVTVVDNTVYNSRFAIWINRKQFGSTTNNVIKKNIFYGLTTEQYMAGYANSGLNNEPYFNINEALQGFAYMDSNYFRMVRPGGFYRYYAVTQGGSYTFPSPDMTLNSWRDNAKHDVKTDTISTTALSTGHYNASSEPMVVTFEGKRKVDIYGKIYNNSATVSAWSSLILISDGDVEVPNVPPHAQGNKDTTITLPVSSILLDGTRSSDEDGSIVAHSWEFISGPDGAVFTTPDQPTTRFKNLVEGYYSVKLWVTDDKGAIDDDQINITVLPAIPVDNKPPTIEIEADTILPQPMDSTYLTAIVNDEDGTIEFIRWEQINGIDADIESSRTPDTWITHLSIGINVFELTVIDNRGATTTKRVRVIVTPPQNP